MSDDSSRKEVLSSIERTLQGNEPQHAKEKATYWLGHSKEATSFRWALLILRSRAHDALKDLDAAIVDLKGALNIDGRHARLWNDLGILWVDKKKSQHAASAFTQATKIDPQYVRAWANLGLARRDCGDSEAARRALQKAVSIDSRYALGWANLASLERNAGREDEAEGAARRALSLNPKIEFIWVLLTALYQKGGRLEETIACARQGIEFFPKNDRLYALLGDAYAERGDPNLAKQAYHEAVRLRPTALRASIRQKLVLPMVYESREALIQARDCFDKGLLELEEGFPDQADSLSLESLLPEIRHSNFFLAYQGIDDLDFQKRYAQLIANAVDKVAPELRRELPRQFKRQRKIRIGFVSSFFREGTVGRYFEHWLTDLGQLFEIFLYQLWPGQDRVTARLQARANHTRMMAAKSTLEIIEQIREDHLDILLYPELGMDAVCFSLAALRLAPLQCSAWGHPVTTGHSMIDVFFSCAEMEPEGAAHHYSERLVLLPGLGTHYKDPFNERVAPDRENLGLPAQGALLLCPQSLFKIHPDNDVLFSRILNETTDAHLIFFEGRHPAWRKQFETRLQATLTPECLDQRRIHFLPSCDHDHYLAINRASDLMLDTLHWSGGNTSLDALAMGLPVVTLPGRFMRGRQSMAMLNMMEIPELIVRSEECYVERVVSLLQDQSMRRLLSVKIIENKHRLFDQVECISELQNFLINEYLG